MVSASVEFLFFVGKKVKKFLHQFPKMPSFKSQLVRRSNDYLNMKLKWFPITFFKESMKRRERKLEISLETKAMEIENLLATIEKKDEEIRSLEETVALMRNDQNNLTAAQNKCKQLESELFEVQAEIELLLAELSMMQDKLKVNLFKLDFDLSRDSWMLITVTVTALACLFFARKVV